jgi:hypothetical protein
MSTSIFNAFIIEILHVIYDEVNCANAFLADLGHMIFKILWGSMDLPDGTLIVVP